MHLLPRAVDTSWNGCTVIVMSSATPTVSHNHPTDGWRTVSFITWIGVLASVLAVAISSRTIGRPIWWLGPSSNPAPIFYLLIPIAIVGTPLFVTMRHPERIVRVGLMGSFALLISAMPDLGSNSAIAVAILTIGLAAMASSIALLLVLRKYR
jgi:hypothetical protein